MAPKLNFEKFVKKVGPFSQILSHNMCMTRCDMPSDAGTCTYVTTFCVSTSHTLQLLSPEAVSSCFPSGDQLSYTLYANKSQVQKVYLSQSKPQPKWGGGGGGEPSKCLHAQAYLCEPCKRQPIRCLVLSLRVRAMESSRLKKMYMYMYTYMTL